MIVFEIEVGSKQNVQCKALLNGTVVLEPLDFENVQSCLAVIEIIKERGLVEDNYYKGYTSSGQYFFTLMSENGEVIAESRKYYTPELRDEVIKSIQGHLSATVLRYSK